MILDETDQAILSTRQAKYNTEHDVQVGEFIRFSDGTIRRISYIWPDGVQSTDNRFGPMSFYLGDGYVSYSGSLYRCVPRDSLKLTNEKESGGFWFFHHDFPTAHNGVDFMIPCRIWESSELPPE